MHVRRVVVKTTTILDSAFTVMEKFATKEWEVGVHRVVVKITTVLDCAFAVMEKFATKE